MIINVNKKEQSGVVLVIGLIMLLLLTLIGVTGMQVSSLEEKMAGNNRDKNTAFQAAEAALRAGEQRINNFTSQAAMLAAFTGNNGLFGKNDALPDFATAATWTSNATSISFNSSINGVATPPRYYIKYLNTQDVSLTPGIVPSSYFMVTARGTGGRDSSQVILRSHYAKKF